MEYIDSTPPTPFSSLIRQKQTSDHHTVGANMRVGACVRASEPSPMSTFGPIQ
jgi:hypothetical protein